MQLLINTNNWPDRFPETPEAKVMVRNDHQYLYLRFEVEGDQLRAVAAADQGRVWEDSCVECFCQVPGDAHYINLESNCIGAMVASRRLSRKDEVVPFTPAEMQQIVRRCSLPREPFEERDGHFSWWVELDIPLSLIFRQNPPSFPQPLLVNFYKCADKTRKPHFLSWQPIPLPAPDFHCPQFFGEITLE